MMNNCISRLVETSLSLNPCAVATKPVGLRSLRRNWWTSGTREVRDGWRGIIGIAS
ncbi:hypothetical protein M434DRAFT_395998 [Hypoxylon sp. CO27-5]|nr:hypothetical protein M434DRAFT_395998 [Hypoxylon sp. CO27-5]